MKTTKTLFLTIALLFIGATSMHAQVRGAADSLRNQASRMANALIKGDYNTFIHYIYPKVVQMSGGAENLKSILTQTFSQLASAGMSFQSVTVDSPTTIIKVGTQLQSTAQQHTTINMKQGHSIATTTLVCLSNDNGVHWKFVDANHKTADNMKQVIPNLSNAIVIPPQQAPVHFDN